MECFDLVYDRSSLREIIKFIGDGFDLNTEKRQKFLTLVEKNPSDIPLAAISRVNGVIKQAILLIHQRCYLNCDTDFCLNLSSWYAVPEYRGIEAILFIKNLLKFCSSFTLTDYTPSAEAATVLKALGFTTMNIVKHQFGLTANLAVVFRLNRLSCYFLHSHGRSLLTFESLHAANSMGSQISNYYWVTLSKKSFLKARIINLFIKDVGEIKRPSLFEIVILMLKFRAISLNIFLCSNELNGEDCYGPWLIKSPKTKTYVVPPIASELTVLSIR